MNCFSRLCAVGIVLGVFGCGGTELGTEATGGSQQSLDGCPLPALGQGNICELGRGSVRYQVTLDGNQAYVEVFSRQNGLQNIATNIVGSELKNSDGSSTYSYTASGYSANDVIEYRFYSYLPLSPGVFTPGPEEMKWYRHTYSASQVDVSASKDATLLLSSYCCGGDLANRNFGANSTVDAGTYHHTAKGLFGYSLPNVPASLITKVELVAPSVSNTSAPYGTVSVAKVDSGLSTSWQESTVTWNNAPSAGSEGGALTFPIVAGVNRFDVTTFAKQEVAGHQPEISFLITPGVGNTFIGSKENPAHTGTYLHITYARPDALLSGAWKFASSDLTPSTAYSLDGDTIHLTWGGNYQWNGTWSSGFNGYTFERSAAVVQGGTYRLSLAVSNTSNPIPVVLRASVTGAGSEQQQSLQGNRTIEMDFTVSADPGAAPVVILTAHPALGHLGPVEGIGILIQNYDVKASLTLIR